MRREKRRQKSERRGLLRFCSAVVLRSRRALGEGEGDEKRTSGSHGRRASARSDLRVSRGLHGSKRSRAQWLGLLRRCRVSSAAPLHASPGPARTSLSELVGRA